MKTIRTPWTIFAGICAGGLIVIVAAINALSQTVPFLTVAATGTNQISITITNGIGGANYEVWWTPVLASPDYPWTTVAVGTPGQTNFTFNIGGYASGFFEGVYDTNAIPLWEAANPTNSSLGILSVLIDSPTNNSVLQ